MSDTKVTILDWCFCRAPGCGGWRDYTAHRAAISQTPPTDADITHDEALQERVRTATRLFRNLGAASPLEDALIEVFDITPDDPSTYVGKAARR